jgi:Kdo2-lipid IVA lauroyltransferase/acyltransferase
VDDAAAGSPPRRGGWPGATGLWRLLGQAETAAFWLVAAPLLALLPARLAYRAACWRGDWTFWSAPAKRGEVTRHLRQVLGDELGQAEAKRLARDVFRIRTCEIIDLMRLRGQARSLRGLVEVRGREHLDAALAEGKGAILCSPHSGSYICAFSLLHADGFPLTSIGRWWWNYPPGQSSVTRRMWDFVYARRVLRHRQRPSIEPWPGRVQVAVQAAAALRDNEVVTICSDAPPLEAERSRAVEVPFLGRQASLLPGLVGLARLTGAPVLMASVHRAADYRHQVLEISPPLSMEGDPAAAFARCVAAMDAAVRANPAEWDFWFEPGDLARLGLLSGAPRPAAPGDDRAGRMGELQQSSRLGISARWMSTYPHGLRPTFSCCTRRASMTFASATTCCSPI